MQQYKKYIYTQYIYNLYIYIYIQQIYIYIHKYIYYHSFFIYSSVDGHLHCFHVLAIINSAAVNMGVLLNVHFLGRGPWHGMWDFSSIPPGMELVPHALEPWSPLTTGPPRKSHWASFLSLVYLSDFTLSP